MIEKIEHIGPLLDLSIMRKEIENLKSELEDLRKSFDASASIKVGENITRIYRMLKNECNFADEDLLKDDFKIIFDAKTVQLYGQISERISLIDGSEITLPSQYNPGSMARQTTWQVLGYLLIMDYILKNFSGLPLMPLLVLDNISMPYDIRHSKNNYAAVFKLIKSFAYENNIQLIITSNIACYDIG